MLLLLLWLLLLLVVFLTKPLAVKRLERRLLGDFLEPPGNNAACLVNIVRVCACDSCVDGRGDAFVAFYFCYCHALERHKGDEKVSRRKFGDLALSPFSRVHNVIYRHGENGMFKVIGELAHVGT